MGLGVSSYAAWGVLGYADPFVDTESIRPQLQDKLDDQAAKSRRSEFATLALLYLCWRPRFPVLSLERPGSGLKKKTC